MQGKNLTLSGAGLGTVVAPCACEAVDIISVAHTFTFQYADGTSAANPIGDAVSAAAYSATYFEFKADNGGKGFAWAAGQTIGYIVGTAADVIGIRPRVIGH